MKETKLRIRFWGDPILKKKCLSVKEVNDDLRSLLDQMYVLMKVTDGVGLAGNQAGLNKRLVVVEYENNVFKLINPKIIKKEDQIVFEEGCLSFPGINIEIKRSGKVWVKALNEAGEKIDIEAEGLLAVILQHEIDHINGVVFIDRISLFRRLKLTKQLRKIKKERNKCDAKTKIKI